MENILPEQWKSAWIRRNVKAKPAYAVFQYHMGRWYDGDFSSFH